jgi:hypothetical protein
LKNLYPSVYHALYDEEVAAAFDEAGIERKGRPSPRE